MTGGTELVSSGVVGMVGIEALCDGPRRDRERPPPGGGLDGLEVQLIDRAWSDQRFDLGDDFRRERGGERRFFSTPEAGIDRASQIASLTSSSRLQVSRKLR